MPRPCLTGTLGGVSIYIELGRTIEGQYTGCLIGHPGCHPDDDIQDEVIDLATTALVWMFSTSNRSLRDKATKATCFVADGQN